MNNKIQSMLTIALTAAVLTLLVDKVSEPAQAQNCASQDDVEEQADRVIQRVLYCIDGSSVDGRLSTFCNY
jgi:hypothetical protein